MYNECNFLYFLIDMPLKTIIKTKAKMKKQCVKVRMERDIA